MEKVYLTPQTAKLDMYERISANEVEPYCAKCKAKLEVLRIRGEPDGAVHSIRCPTDHQHFMKTYSVVNTEWDRMLGREPKD